MQKYFRSNVTFRCCFVLLSETSLQVKEKIAFYINTFSAMGAGGSALDLDKASPWDFTLGPNLRWRSAIKTIKFGGQQELGPLFIYFTRPRAVLPPWGRAHVRRHSEQGVVALVESEWRWIQRFFIINSLFVKIKINKLFM